MSWSARYLRAVGVSLVLGGADADCAGPGEYVWFQQLPSEATLASNEYIIAVGDVVSIRVLGHEEMTLKQRVRSDGRLALLLIGDVEAKGKHPSGLKAELEGRLKDYIVSPSVAVNIDEAQPMTVLLLGEIARPGVYPLDQGPTLMHALALGGGLTDFASRSSVFVVRAEPKPMRIRFTYEAITRNLSGAGDFQMHRGDLVEVE
jgi:polysaccharide export outer membrane protein